MLTHVTYAKVGMTKRRVVDGHLRIAQHHRLDIKSVISVLSTSTVAMKGAAPSLRFKINPRKMKLPARSGINASQRQRKVMSDEMPWQNIKVDSHHPFVYVIIDAGSTS